MTKADTTLYEALIKRGHLNKEALEPLIKPQKCVKTVFLGLSTTMSVEKLLAKTKIPRAGAVFESCAEPPGTLCGNGNLWEEAKYFDVRNW